METAKKTNREVLDTILNKIRNLQEDINMVKRDIQYIKTLKNCENKVEQSAGEVDDIQTGWIGWRGIL
tara:strand:+ start:2222 stop:2425 length:204 start_codon:yes stop_codon:yes gene_type:complete